MCLPQILYNTDAMKICCISTTTHSYSFELEYKAPINEYQFINMFISEHRIPEQLSIHR